MILRIYEGIMQSIEERLISWKAIAAHLKTSVRTVQRWEVKEHLPVHRHFHNGQHTVYADRKELDRWWQKRRSRLSAWTFGGFRFVVVAAICIGAVAAILLVAQWFGER